MRMLNDMEDGKDGVDFVLVFKLSRFGRNAADVLSSLQIMVWQIIWTIMDYNAKKLIV